MKFSIIIPVYNKAQFIVEALDSIRAQIYKDYEIIIIDDGSTDDLDSTLKLYPETIVLKQKNAGVSVARNNGIKIAKGDFVTFLDADDRWGKNHLQVLSDLIDKYPKEKYFATSHTVTTVDGKSTISSDTLVGYEKDFVCKNVFKILNDVSDSVLHTNSMCINRCLLIDNDLFFEPGERIGEDTDLWLRVGLSNSIVISKEPTTFYRREFSTATKVTTNSLTWIFARRVSKLSSHDYEPEVWKECNKLLDRYKMKCSRDYLILKERRKAKEVLRTVKYRNFKYFVSCCFCLLPYKVFSFINRKFI